jgi:hypothetical protein
VGNVVFLKKRLAHSEVEPMGLPAVLPAMDQPMGFRRIGGAATTRAFAYRGAVGFCGCNFAL